MSSRVPTAVPAASIAVGVEPQQGGHFERFREPTLIQLRVLS